MTLGDRIAVMREGVLQQLGTPDDIYTRPATVFVAQFIGSPAMNLVQAQWMGGALSMQGTALPLSDAAGRALAARNPASVVYGLRPEALRLSDRGLPGQLRMVEPTGPETYAYVDTAVGPMVLRVPGRVAQPVGSNVLLDWNEAEVHLFDGQSEQRIEVGAASAGAKVTPLYAQGA